MPIQAGIDISFDGISSIHDHYYESQSDNEEIPIQIRIDVSYHGTESEN